QFAANIGKRALRALWSFAYPASHADGCRNIRIAEIQSFCINQPLGMLHIASQRHGEILCWMSESAGLMTYRSRNPQVNASVRHAGQLPENSARAGEGLVHIP